MYASINFSSKKAFREAVEKGRQITVRQPNGGLTGAPEPVEGTVSVEGPWYPTPHRWYAKVTLKAGVVAKVE